ncbi:MAG: metal ABC transporter permease, partial [bacterium]
MSGIEANHLPGILGYLTSPFVERALIATVLIAINAGIAGSFTTFRSSVFLVAGSAHAALAGAAGIILLQYFGMLAGVDPMIGGSITSILLARLAAKVSMSGKHGDVDTAIGVGFAFSMAIAVLLISMIPESAS